MLINSVSAGVSSHPFIFILLLLKWAGGSFRHDTSWQRRKIVSCCRHGSSAMDLFACILNIADSAFAKGKLEEWWNVSWDGVQSLPPSNLSSPQENFSPGFPVAAWPVKIFFRHLASHNQEIPMQILNKLLVAKLCPTLCDPIDCSPPVSSVHGILQARILERVAIPFSRGSFWPRDQTHVSCVTGRFFTIWATREAWT